jgi:hypothetical protein
LTGVLFLVNRDGKFVAITLVVLSLLGYALFFAGR